MEYQSHLAVAVAESRLSAERVREEHATRLQRIQELHEEVPLADQTSEAIQLLKEIISNSENAMTDDSTHKLGDILATISNEVPSFIFEEEPHTWEEAKQSPNATRWESGHCKELKSLKEMGVYELIL